jgi:hypothetical protein
MDFWDNPRRSADELETKKSKMVMTMYKIKKNCEMFIELKASELSLRYIYSVPYQYHQYIFKPRPTYLCSILHMS